MNIYLLQISTLDWVISVWSKCAATEQFSFIVQMLTVTHSLVGVSVCVSVLYLLYFWFVSTIVIRRELGFTPVPTIRRPQCECSVSVLFPLLWFWQMCPQVALSQMCPIFVPVGWSHAEGVCSYVNVCLCASKRMTKIQTRLLLFWCETSFGCLLSTRQHVWPFHRDSCLKKKYSSLQTASPVSFWFYCRIVCIINISHQPIFRLVFAFSG